MVTGVGVVLKTSSLAGLVADGRRNQTDGSWHTEGSLVTSLSLRFFHVAASGETGFSLGLELLRQVLRECVPVGTFFLFTACSWKSCMSISASSYWCR